MSKPAQVHTVLNRDSDEVRVPSPFGVPLLTYLNRKGLRGTLSSDRAGDVIVLDGEPDMGRVRMYLDDWERAATTADESAGPTKPAPGEGLGGASAAGNELPADFPRPGTPEWRAMNARRGVLIRRDLAGKATDAERAELEQLERFSDLSLARWGLGGGAEG